MRKILAILAFAFATSASASTLTSEITDLWWVPSESGWGVNIVLQNGTAFATFFIYDTSDNPVWYSAQLTYQGNSLWSGGLYATTGPWFGGPFPPTTTIRLAGTMSFSLAALNQGNLTYTVDGVTVTKTVQRQTLANENYSGTYAGGYSLRFSSCNPASSNGIAEVSGLLQVNQFGTNVTMNIVSSALNCTYTGTYNQTGKLGAVAGGYSCDDGSQGLFQLVEMTPTISGFTARASGQNQSCQWTGYVGGIARAQ